MSYAARLRPNESIVQSGQDAGALPIRGRAFMFENYIIEVRPPSAGIVLQAGIVVRDGRSFKFFAASHLFGPLEGERFENPKTAEQAALRRITDVTRRRQGTAISCDAKLVAPVAKYGEE